MYKILAGCKSHLYITAYKQVSSFLRCPEIPLTDTMPPSRQSVSAIRSQRSGLVLSGDTHAQNELIKVLGPYFARAKFEDCGSEFLARFFNIWFTRWPLKVSDFEDEDFLLHHRQSVEKVGIYPVPVPVRIHQSIRSLATAYGGLVSPKSNRSTHGDATWLSARPDTVLRPGLVVLLLYYPYG